MLKKLMSAAICAIMIGVMGVSVTEAAVHHQQAPQQRTEHRIQQPDNHGMRNNSQHKNNNPFNVKNTSFNNKHDNNNHNSSHNNKTPIPQHPQHR